MQVAVVSDIHGNRHAFEAVLADIAPRARRRDLVPGRPRRLRRRPRRLRRAGAEHCDVCLAGNHDLAVTGELSLDEFSRGAAIAARWTQEVIGPENLAFLAALEPPGAADERRPLPRQPARPDLGVRAQRAAGRAVPGRPATERDLPDRPLPRRAVVRAARGRAGHRRAAPRRRRGLDLAEGEWLLNPGSVGQPRDGDPRAAWLLLDTGEQRATWRRAEYDVAGAPAAIRAARLPESLAERLEYGQ